ncbi:MAG: hypothetical protein JNJ88_16855 [Planctomycetes bacterium]|nr:hypothetical protein [Planctomycetota bacterium]
MTSLLALLALALLGTAPAAKARRLALPSVEAPAASAECICGEASFARQGVWCVAPVPAQASAASEFLAICSTMPVGDAQPQAAPAIAALVAPTWLPLR